MSENDKGALGSMEGETPPRVTIQTEPLSVPAVPPWFGEVVLRVTHLKQQGALTKLCERVRFARRRGVYYEVIDFLAVLFGYAISVWRAHSGGILRDPPALCWPLHGSV